MRILSSTCKQVQGEPIEECAQSEISNNSSTHQKESILNTLTAKIALTNLPPEVRSTPPLFTIETPETPFLEKKYHIGFYPTYRTLIVRFSKYSEQIQSNEKLMEVLKKIERIGLSVPTEKLFNLQEDVTVKWNAQYENTSITLFVEPKQKELSSIAPILIYQDAFEEAFKTSLLESEKQ